MSRPCFALSVMLSTLALALFAVDKTHASNDVISPSHDASECIVCPLAHGPLELCAIYDEYDYYDYDYDYGDNAEPAPAPPADDAAEEQAVEETAADTYEEYEDYDWYAEEFGHVEDSDAVIDDVLEDTSVTEEEVVIDDSAVTEDIAVEEAAVADAVSVEDTTAQAEDGEDASVESDVVSDIPDEYSDDVEVYDELMENESMEDGFPYYSGYESPEDLVDEAEASEEPTSTDTPDPLEDVRPVDEPAAGEPGDDYDCYEFEGFDSYDEFMEAHGSMADEVNEAAEEGFDPATAATEESLESDWADGDYGYYEDYLQETDEYEFDASPEPEADIPEESTDPVETGYDEAYDAAMTTEPADDDATAEISAEDSSDIYDEYESFYDTYDGLYNYEEQVSDDTEAPCRPGPIIAEFEAAEPLSAEELATDLLDPLTDEYSDSDLCHGCEWDCEGSYWDEPVETSEPATSESLILNVAQSLDDMAVTLQKTADTLREVATGKISFLSKKAAPVVR